MPKVPGQLQLQLLSQGEDLQCCDGHLAVLMCAREHGGLPLALRLAI